MTSSEQTRLHMFFCWADLRFDLNVQPLVALASEGSTTYGLGHSCHSSWLPCWETVAYMRDVDMTRFHCDWIVPKDADEGKTRCLQRSSRDHVSLPLLSQSSSVPSWWVRELRENERVPQAAIFFLYSRWLNFGIKYVLGCPSYLVNGAKRPQSRVPSTCRRLFSRGHVSKLSDMVSHGSY